ncbi:uncharacterized protein METZ01_LOCUS336104 [marine metagenome]|uniref:Uncharacterized protein n=1 Tax=marine metagenome TaxID=408172 RepID=A0A382QE69_9ZZZZ
MLSVFTSLIGLIILSYYLGIKYDLLGVMLGCIIFWLIRNIVGGFILGRIFLKETVFGKG